MFSCINMQPCLAHGQYVICVLQEAR
jgi:hypothetical protein